MRRAVAAVALLAMLAALPARPAAPTPTARPPTRLAAADLFGRRLGGGWVDHAAQTSEASRSERRRSTGDEPRPVVAVRLLPALSVTRRSPVTRPATKAVTVGNSVTSGAGGAWACIRQHESGGNYADKRNPAHRGAYQASWATWRSYWTRHGRPDLAGIDPADASAAVQDQFAIGLQQEAGWGQWPQTSRMCGLR